MKLLLTSGGLRNPALVKTFLRLAGQPADKLKVAFISTATNINPGNKSWAIYVLDSIQRIGAPYIDILDIASLPKDNWLPRLKDSNVIFVNGGNTTYLMECFNQSGLTKEIPNLLKTRVYVGLSAGSYIATPDLRFNSDDTDKVLDGLNLVDFGLQAHYKSPLFPLAKSYEAVKKRVKGCPYTVYALDDETAISIDGKKMEIVGEGKHVVFLPKDKDD